MKAKYYLFTLVIIIFFGCKKYPKNYLVFNTPKNAIAGDWKLDSYSVDGVDSIGYNDMSVYVNSVFVFYKGETQGTFGARDESGRLILNDNSGYTKGSGSWILDLKKKNVSLGFAITPSPNPQKNIFRAKGYWKIEKLNRKQFWISNSIGNVIFQIRFKK